ncbi:STAS domain-containing protein [Brachyspira sp. G79]|uniref:STAS domain-containing protein n=1 Tax=Brachyspira sp. G79 TaxID=1358104 RepID=UPI000BBCAF27|nr:STAS domain-containing protein [Brachyspira sp. G79]PCG21037.1 anti-sigma factor antagonist [Brachyspira sp. G79]
MEVSVKELENNTAILKLDGDIDVYTSSDLKDVIFSQIELGAKKIIIDMEDVYYIDSSGIGVFISALGTFKKVNGKICFVKVTEPVKKVFELTKITSFFPIFTSETEAMDKF